MFATTAHLNLRAYRESDGELIHNTLFNDPRVMRTLTIDYVVPDGPGSVKKLEEELVEKALMFVVIDVKREFVGMRNAEDDEGSRGARGAKDEKDEATTRKDDLFVGYCALRSSVKKNRDTGFAIALRPCWWGKGFGTEATRWLVDYAFEQLDMHRVSLGLLASNERGLALYKTVGFVEEGRKRRAIFIDRKWVDDVSMGILVDEWEARRKQ